jgi:predicted CxxxxCH...CXXCH cytochrome family protein
VDAAGEVIPPASGGRHLDGVVQSSGHTPQWMDPSNESFHARSANQGLAPCGVCHGPALDGVGGTGAGPCARCHVPVNGVAWTESCVMCHGGTDNATGAPPKATWGSTSAVAVGAHTRHVGANRASRPIACEECHTRPADVFAAGHVSGQAAVAFAGPLAGTTGGTWNQPGTGLPTCSSTYCHGNFKRGNLTNVPSWTGTNQAACGTCHAARPVAYLHQRHQRDSSGAGLAWWPLPGGSAYVTCGDCHDGIAASTSNTGLPTLATVSGAGPVLHVDGKPDVVFRAGGTYSLTTATEGSCSSMACHPGETKAWPR